MTIKTKFPRISSYELLHRYANSVKIHEAVGLHKYDKNVYFYKGVKRAIFSTEKKILIVEDFGTNRFNGITNYHLIKAFDNFNFEIIKVTNDFNLNLKLLNSNDILTEDIIHLAVISNIKLKTNELLKNIARLRDDIDNPKLHKIYCNINTEFDENSKFDEILKLIKTYNVTPDELSDTINRVWYDRYKGWSRFNGHRNFNNITYYEFVNTGKITTSEINYITKKNWTFEYYYGFKTGLSPKYKSDVYDNLELREQREIFVKTEREKERIKKEQELSKRSEKYLSDWLNGNINHSLYNIPIHLRFNKDKTVIETTRNASVPIEAGKRVFKLFNEYIKNNKDYVAPEDKHLKIGVYNLNKIIVSENEPFIQIGCHTLYKREIDKFINDNTLQNWYE